MKYVLIQTSEHYGGSLVLTVPCFKLYSTEVFDSLEIAELVRKQSDHPDWLIILQAW